MALPCRHFGEAPASAAHAMAACSKQCDVCASPVGPTRRDITAEAHALVSVLASVPAQDKRLTLIQLIDRWRASKVLFSPGHIACRQNWPACLAMGVMRMHPCLGAPASRHHALQYATRLVRNYQSGPVSHEFSWCDGLHGAKLLCIHRTPRSSSLPEQAVRTTMNLSLRRCCLLAFSNLTLGLLLTPPTPT